YTAWCGQLYVGPAEIGDRFLADIGYANAGDNRQSQAAIDDRPTELGFGGIGRIEMQRVLVHRQEREPGVVGLADRAPGAVLVDIADREFLETAPGARAEPPRPDLSRDCDHCHPPNPVPLLASTAEDDCRVRRPGAMWWNGTRPLPLRFRDTGRR